MCKTQLLAFSLREESCHLFYNFGGKALPQLSAQGRNPEDVVDEFFLDRVCSGFWPLEHPALRVGGRWPVTRARLIAKASVTPWSPVKQPTPMAPQACLPNAHAAQEATHSY